MSNWIDIGPVTDFSEAGAVEVNGESIAVFHLEDRFYAIDDQCSHGYASLADGDIEGENIRCPHNGALFSIITGKNLTLPAIRPVRTWNLREEKGHLYLEWKDE